MPRIAVDVSDEIAGYWAQVADDASVPLETWLAVCGLWGAALGFPITRIVFRQPPAAHVLEGVAWEVGEFPHLTCPPRSEEGDAPMINKVILVGNLGRDPEMRSTTSGVPIAQLSLATNRRWKDSDGNRHEQTDWHRVVCFGRQAELAGQYLSRGRLIYVEGRNQTRSWEDRQTGETKYSTEIVADYFLMLDQREGGGGAWSAGDGASDSVESAPDPPDNDIPF